MRIRGARMPIAWQKGVRAMTNFELYKLVRKSWFRRLVDRWLK